MPKNNDKLKELLEQAEQGTKAVFESENYRNYLATMSKFHSYSFRNSLLILMQKPEATHVAGYAAWKKKFNRQVQRGESGIQIVGYSPRKVNVEQEKKDSSGNTIIGADGKPVMEKVTRQVPSYVPVSVFDVSQTEGEPLPQLVNELNGSVEAYQDLMQAIRDVSPFPVSFEEIQGGAKGFCDPVTQRIVIQQGMSEAQSVKTAIHEVTHADLHAPEQNLILADRTDRRTREIEAESTAFVVCEHYGIDTSDYTFPYLASWSSSKELAELQSSLETIQKQAGDLIDKIDTRLTELQKDKEKDLFTEITPDQVKTLASSFEKVDSFGFEKLPEFAQDIEDQQQEADVASFEKYQGISSEEARRHEEMLDTVRFDGDIDLDREKTREQLGFRDQNKEQPKAAQEPQKKISMKERMAAAQAEADRRNSSHSLNQPQRDKTAERGE